MNILTDILPAVVSAMLTGGGLSALLYRNFSKRLKSAEAQRAELDNEISLAEEWRKVAESREEKLVAKDAKIDSMYDEIADIRAKYNAELIRNNQLEIESANLRYRMCERRGCINRKPESDY